MNAKRTALLAALVVLLSAPAASAYQASQGPSEVLAWNPALAFEGYTLFAAHGPSASLTYLIDMSGSVVHTWNVGTNPKLLSNGHILDASKDDPSGFGGFEEVDWDSNVVWQYTEKRSDHAPHHDFIRVHNPKLDADTTMYIANVTMTNAQALAVGADPANAPYDGAQADAVVEVDASGTVVWEWWFLDHLVQDDNAAWPNYAGAGKTIANAPGRLDVNLPGRPLRKDWLHCNSLDYNEGLDQVVINTVQGEFVVVDHGGTFVVGDPAASIAAAATTKGDFLYRFGDPARYKQGDPPSIPLNWTTASSGNKQIGGAHDIHWVAPGLPGAGHFLVFNNGQYLFELTNQSYADEIDPYLGADGADAAAYVNPPDAGYTVYEPPKDTAKPKKNVSKQISWSYGTQSPSGMASHIGGSAQRLPNGNTLICADTEGHFMEVTTAGQVVWEYVNPVTKDQGPLKIIPDAVPMSNSVFRAYRYAPDFAAFVGHDLAPKGLITDIGITPLPDPGPGDLPDTTSPDVGTADVAEAVSPDAGPRDTPDAIAAVDTVGQQDVPATSCDPGQLTCQCPASKGCTAGPAGAGSGSAGLLVAMALAALAGSRRRRTCEAGRNPLYLTGRE